MARWTARVEFLLSVTELLFPCLTVEALQGKMCQNLLPSGRVGHLEARLQGKGSSPCQYIDTNRKAIDCATTLPLTVSAFTFAVCYRPSVCLSSVTFVRPTQAVQIFGNISTALGTLAIQWHPLKISRRSSPGNPSAGKVKHERGSQA